MALRELGALLRITADIKGAQQYTNALNNAKKSTDQMGLKSGKAVALLGQKVNTSLNNQGNNIRKVSATWRDSYGRTFNTTYRQTTKGLKALTANTVRYRKAVKKGSSITNDFTKALRRVMVVVPMWHAFRMAMQTVTATIREGFKYWEDFDKAITKTTQVIHTKSQSIGSAVVELTDKIRNLSINTGESMAKLANTFYKFGTVGLEFENSMQGMEAASKLAITTFGDVNQIGKIVAQVYRLLGDNMNSAIPPHQRMNVIGAQIYKVWQTNAFEIGEMTNAFQKFLPTAKAFNIGVTDSVALLSTLHTAGIKGGRAGRLLKGGISKLVDNLGDLASELGIHVNPELDTTIDILLKVLGTVKTLQSGGANIEKITKALGVFGQIRTREAGMGIMALYDNLLKDLQAINPENENYIKLLKEQDKAHKDIIDSLGKQLDRFRNLKKLVGEAFVKGVTGADNFKDALKEVNHNIATSISFFKRLGVTINWTHNALVETALWLTATKPYEAFFLEVIKNADRAKKQVQEFRDAMAGKKPLVEVEDLIQKLETKHFKKSFLKLGIDPQMVLDGLKATKARIENDPSYLLKVKFNLFDEKTGKTIKQFTDRELREMQQQADMTLTTKGKEQINIKSSVREQISLLERELKVIQQQAKGVSDVEIAHTKLANLINERVDQFNLIAKNSKGQVKALDSEKIMAMALNKEYEKLAQTLNVRVGAQEQIAQVAKLVNAIEGQAIERNVDLTRHLIDHELELARIKGASNLEVMRARAELEQMHGLDQDAVSLLKNKLDIEKEITREKLGQKNLSSETIKLYEIGQRFGTGMAQQISQVLSGGAGIGNLSKRAKAVFRTQFGSQYKQMEAQKYFTRGMGRGIDIPERAELDTAKASRRIRERTAVIAPKTETTINVNIDSEDLKRKIVESWLKEINKVEFQKLIRKQIENY